MKTQTLTALIMSSSLVFLSGCYTTPVQEGALWGGAIGAAAGQIIGRDSKSTMAGAGIGALAGGLINDQIHRSRQQGYSQGYNQGYNRSYSPQGYGQANQARFNPFAPVSGYYNPPNSGNRYTSYHNNSYNVNGSAAVNGYPVSNREDLHILREATEISQRQQELDHRQAMDRARQQESELRTYSDIARDVIWETRGWY